MNRNVGAGLRARPKSAGRHRGLPLQIHDSRRMLPPRPADSHKGRNGHLLAIAGSRGMSGAAALVALGALKAGAGLVTVAIPESERRTILPRFPELLSLGLPETRDGCMSPGALDVLNLYRRKHPIAAVALGPGISTHPSVGFIVKSILKHWDIPLVLDADGINQCRPSDLRRYPELVLTPHPGEFARLLGLSPADVKKDGMKLAETLAREQKVVCVLKGHRTITTNGSITWRNTTGNAAMATGGMGDVLTGIIGSFLAQGLAVLDAAAAGVFIHGLAGDLAAVSDRGLLATELALAVPLALKAAGLKKHLRTSVNGKGG